MFRRNLFVVVVMLGLIASVAFTSWTQDTSGAGGSTPPIASSSPPDTTDYSHPATAAELLSSKATSGALSSPGFVVVEVPGATGGEPDIAINPLNLNQIVIHTFAGGNFPLAGNFISSDGGLTWALSAQIPQPPGWSVTGGPNDITQDYGLDGNLYGAYLTTLSGVGPCNPNNLNIYSASNTAPFTGGLFNYFTVAGFAQATNFNGIGLCADQPWLLTNVDPTTAGQTNTYVAYDDDSGNNLRVSAAIGTQPPNFTKDNVSGLYFGGGTNQGLRMAVDPRTGAIYSVYQGCNSNCAGSPKGISYVLNRSLDAGTTWTLNGSGTGITVATGTTVQPTPKFGTVNALLGGIDHAAVDPTTGHVFVVYGDTNGSGGNAIWIVEVGFDNASPTNAIPGTAHQVSLPGAQAALPSVAVAANGTVGVLYTSFDGFDVSGFPIFSGHFAFSTDAGATFTDQNLLTFVSSTKDNGNARQRYLGDYQQLKVVNDLPAATNAGATFYGVFTGNGAALGDPLSSNQAIFFKTTLAPQINVNPNPVSIGNVCKGSTGQAELDVSDTGADNLLINSITRTSGSTDITLAAGPTFPVNISPDANFGFTFTCSPTTTGLHSAIFKIVSNDPANPNTNVTVTCNTPAPIINVTGTGIFGSNVCADTSPTPEQTLQVNNVGACDLHVTSAMINCLDFTLVNMNEFPATISHDFGLGVGVNFTPTSTGLKSCKLRIISDDPTSPTDIPLTGTQGTGLMTVTGSGDFGAAVCGGKAPPQSLKVNNVGPCNLVVQSAVINCPVTVNNPGGLPQFKLVNPGEFPATISADSGLDVGINFTPTQAGLQTCTITFTSAAPNPQTIVVPLTGNTPFGSSEIKVTVPPGLTFPPTVIQQNGVCSSKAGVPITNVGACPVNITDVDILTQSSKNPPGFDYMLTGVPQLTSPTLGGPITQTLVPGGQLGSGDLNLIFAPFKVVRTSTGTVKVVFEDDPILHTFKTDTVPVCGEAVQRGMRVIVTLAGVPVPLVNKIALQRAIGNGNFSTLQSFKNSLLRTVTGTAPCASFKYHAEFGGNTNPIQLKTGNYRIKVSLKIGTITRTAVVLVNLDHCTFNPNVVVAF